MSFPRFERALELLKETHKHKYIDQDWMRLDRFLEHVIYGRMTTLGRKKDDRSKVAYGPEFNMVKAVNKRRFGGPLVPQSSARNYSDREKVALAKRPKPSSCETCARPHENICWDHDHNTGNFRGWICSDCNTALGFVADSPERLRRLADYLEQHAETERRRLRPATETCCGAS